MTGNGDFAAELERVIAERRQFLERRELPRLKEQFRIYQTGVKSIVSVLVRKSLIKEDPYKHEQKISEVELPPSGQVVESERIDQIGLRLSEFESQVDFVSDLYQFSLDFLTLWRTKALAELVRYIAWDKLSEISASVNTRIVADLATKVKQSGDKLSAGIFQDAQNQLGKAGAEILRILRDVSTYQRESYKFVARNRLFSGLAPSAEAVTAKRAELMRTLKGRFSALVASDPSAAAEFGAGDRAPAYYPELLGEVLEEDYGEEGEARRRDVIERLRVSEERPAKKDERPLKPLLLESLRLLSAAVIPLESASEKISDNYQAYTTRRVALGDRLRRWLRRLLREGGRAQPVEIEIVDPTTSAKRGEELDVKKYLERIERRCRVFGNLSTEGSPALQRLQVSADEQVLKFIALNLDDLHEIVTRLPALDAFFKAALGTEDRPAPRGMKLEVSAIKTAIVKANQKKHEYLSRMEELEQMKRLGIDGEPS